MTFEVLEVPCGDDAAVWTVRHRRGVLDPDRSASDSALVCAVPLQP